MNFKKRSSVNDNDGTMSWEDQPTPVMKKRRLEDMFNLMLSDELVIKIFSYLHYEDLLMAAALVCRRWEYLSTDQDLWRSLNLRNRSNVTVETVEDLLERFKRMKCIKLTQCPLIEDSVIPKITELNTLHTLHLDLDCLKLSPSSLSSIANCRSLKNLKLSQLPVTDETLGMIAESLIKLIQLEISYSEITSNGLLPVIERCTQLKHLDITGCEKMSHQVFMTTRLELEWIVTRIPESLIEPVWIPPSGQEESCHGKRDGIVALDYCRDALEQVDDAFLTALTAKPYQIESLNVSRCKFTAYGLKLLRKLPKLTKFGATSVESMCDDVISEFSNLTSLCLAETRRLGYAGVVMIIRRNPNLEILDLSDCDTVDDSALYIISMAACRLTLKKLAFMGCRISESGMIDILEKCVKLQELYTGALQDDTLEINYPHVRFYGDFDKFYGEKNQISLDC